MTTVWSGSLAGLKIDLKYRPSADVYRLEAESGDTAPVFINLTAEQMIAIAEAVIQQHGSRRATRPSFDDELPPVGLSWRCPEIGPPTVVMTPVSMDPANLTAELSAMSPLERSILRSYLHLIFAALDLAG